MINILVKTNRNLDSEIHSTLGHIWKEMEQTFSAAQCFENII